MVFTKFIVTKLVVHSMVKKSLVIFAYNRPILLQACIESVINAKGHSGWSKVLIYQEGCPETNRIISQYSMHFDLITQIKPQFDIPIANINFNRVTGTTIAFETFEPEYLLGIEEDTLIGYDSLQFAEVIFQKYGHNPLFRGINLGSLEPPEKATQNGYSILRYGLHGQAGVITKRTWLKIRSNKALRDFSLQGWDASVEFNFKSGFVISPNRSRFLDKGLGGTHAPSDPLNSHYINMEKSWVGMSASDIQNYERIQIKHNWRHDCKPFKKRHNLIFFMRQFVIVSRIYNFTKWHTTTKIR